MVWTEQLHLAAHPGEGSVWETAQEFGQSQQQQKQSIVAD